MDGAALVNFPLPMLTALLCGMLALLVWRLDLGITRANATFSTLFALCMLQALLVGLRFGYGISALIPLQRILPLILGPCLYLSFAAMTVDRRGFVRLTLRHIGAPIIALALVWLLVSDLRHLDWVIGASYLFYVFALYMLWRRGPDALIYARVDVTGTLCGWILRAAALLVFILVLDTAIALDFMFNRGTNAPALISYGTAPLIAVLFGVLITGSTIMVHPSKSKPKAPAEQDETIEHRLRILMETEQLFLDHNMTLDRLAKRLHLPARDVSGAINRLRGINVSQYVNAFRLTFAADLLTRSDESVSKIAERSGFMSRSNFYREFQRLHGLSPTEFRKARKNAHVDKT